jgi:methyltransferase (TIGR00027 family)
MREGIASRTAEGVAFRRALHQLVDRPLVFEDPVAISMLRAAAARELQRDPRKYDRSVLGRYLRAFLVVRSRFAEEQLALAVARGVRQYVVLGAGLDTFAQRNPFVAEGLHVFELDHPDTQTVKKARLAAANRDAPNVTFIAADLRHVALGDALRDGGFDPTAPSFFSWLGVLPYLDLAAIRTTFAFVASLENATMVFDYGAPLRLFDLPARFILWRLKRRLASIGEEWKTFLAPQRMLHELQDAGFADAENVSPEQLNRDYFANRSDGLHVGKVGHIAIARTAAAVRDRDHSL